MRQKAPDVTYESFRLVGVELEIDMGPLGDKSLLPPAPQGWRGENDGSLDRGIEYVLAEPHKLHQVKLSAELLSKALRTAGAKPHKKGSMHVHVKADDYSPATAHNLAVLYTAFKPALDQLVAPSRRGGQNQYCRPFTTAMLKADEIKTIYALDTLVASRELAKWSVRDYRYQAVNFSMLKVRNPQARSVEFRQGSPSCRAAVIHGWASLMTALTDYAAAHDATPLTESRQTLASFTDFLARHFPGSSLDTWVQWRATILNSVSDEDPRRVFEALRDRAGGVFYVAKALNIPLCAAQAAIAAAEAKGLIQQVKMNSWRAKYQAWAAQDFQVLLTNSVA